MSIHFQFLAVTILSLVPSVGNIAAAPTAPSVRIAPYRGDRVAALTYTFDDGLRDHHTLAAPQLEEFGFHGTFFIVGKVVAATDAEAAAKKPGAHGGVSWPQVKDLAARGHEIGNHSWSHRQLTKCTDAELADEIDLNAAILKEKLGFAPLTFCYPGNGRNDKVRAAVMRDHIAARERHFEIGQATMTAADANAWADENIAKRGWGIAMIHGITAGYHALSSPEVLREHFAHVKSHDSKIWVDTFANVARYVAERDAAELTVRELTARSAAVVLTCRLSNPPYDVPLTLIIDAPQAGKAAARRGGKALTATVRDGLVLVEAVPAPEEIRVEWE